MTYELSRQFKRCYGSFISPIVTSNGISTATSASPAMSPDAVAIE